MSETLVKLLEDLIRPVHAGLQQEFGVPGTPEAECLSVAIKVQETGQTIIRDQGDPNVIGPATGLWQFERMGGVAEILEDGKTGPIAHELCRRAGVAPRPDPVWRFFTTAAADELACAFARLLIWRDPAPLPPMLPSAEQEAYEYYDRRWRPGAKRRPAWTTSWRSALATCAAAPALSVPGLGGPPAALPPGPPPPVTRPAAPPSQVLPGHGPGVEARLAALEAWATAVARAAGQGPR